MAVNVPDSGNPNGDRYAWSDVIGGYVDTAPWGTGEFAYVPELGIWVELPGENAEVYIYTESEPEEMYSDEEVMQIVEATFRNAGLRKPEDYMTPEELERFGVTDGMGWAEDRVPRLKSKTQMYADAILDFYKAYDFNHYYLEFVSSDAEWVIIRGYYGSDHPG